ncbi:SusC/RagA family TonB-linked outer membrane protein [Olivibacter sitiensis]|uniref:SusC/RagA family TonB-linked outer membrane protein n=1 Tax=Olivibacter sitiensis TaxID=376470 RepID=UPI000426F0AC|nr:TonB-dependent receptor [Olivibacter sitiensis]
MKRKFLLFISCWLMAFWAYGQSRSIKGVVKDENGNTLPGVSVLVKGTSSGTSTDINGAYAIDASPDAILVYSLIGYRSIEEPVNNRETINVQFVQMDNVLDEVVVVGYGTQRKGDITGSVSTVSQKEFDNRPNTQFGSIIQGKMAGVQVLSTSGKPSAGLDIRIRGTSSIAASSSPLYVVDGVPTSDTRSINPSDIESMSVLKDASSAAIYGAQGANGVVLITTKKGKSGEPVFDLNVYNGFTQPWRTLKVLNAEQYRDLMTELGQNTNWDLYTANTDWQREVFQNGSSQNYQLSVSGKTEKTSYFLGGGYVKQVGSVRSSEMERFNFRINLEQELKSWLRVGTNVAYTQYKDVDVSDNQAVNQGGVILGMLSTPPVIGTYKEDGTFTSNPFQDWENPIAFTDGTDRGYKNQRLIGNFYTDVTLLEGLTFRTNFGLDANSAMYDFFQDPFRTSYGRARKGISRNTTDMNQFYIWDNTVKYQKEIGEHKLDALAGTVIQKNRWENNAVETQGFASSSIPTPNAGSVLQTATASKSEKANASFISRVNYSFQDKYLLTVNFRVDGSSNFGPSNRWGYFPSLSAGWRLSEEDFVKNWDLFSDFKLRAGWGLVGNDNVGSYAYLGRVGIGANYPIGGEALPGSYPSTIQNDLLKWESTEQTNVAVDMGFFNNRLTVTAEAYYKNTTDLLQYVLVPKTTGFDSGLQNVGSLQNKGLEFQVSSINTNGPLQWSTDANISFNRNKVVKVIGGELFSGNINGRGEISLSREGKPLGMFYGYVAGGVDPNSGDMYYLAADGQTTFTPVAADRQFIGNPNPDFTYGITNNLSYKGFGLNVFLQGVYGNDIFNATRVDTEGMLDPKNQTIAVIDRWREVGDITDIPRARFANINNSLASTRFIEDGSFLRLRAVTLSYSLSQALLSKIKVKNLRVYATGENLFTITKYTGFDPEVNAFGGSNTALGVDYGTYPQARNLIFGLNMSF